jgi:hypothetical protein
MRPLISDDQPLEGSEPGDSSLDLPAAPIAAKRSAILETGALPISPVGADQFDSPLAELLSQSIGIVRFVPDQTLHDGLRAARSLPWNRDRRERGLRQRHFRRRGEGDENSQRYTLAVCHHHALRTLAPLGVPDFGAPFFAGLNVPSIKVSSQSNRLRASNSARKLRQRSFQTPSSYQRLRRRQHVAGLGYSDGRSRQRAPVLSTQRIPSKSSRLLAQGRPPLGPAGSLGRRGSIFDHCLSVSRMLRPRTHRPPTRPPSWK